MQCQGGSPGTSGGPGGASADLDRYPYLVNDGMGESGLQSFVVHILLERRGRTPSLAIEVVSDEYEKDDDPEQLSKYEQLGVLEVVRYDPEARRVRKPGIYGPRRILSHFVRDEAGRLVEQPVDLRRGLKSSLYGFYLIPAADESLRIAVGPYRRGLWPTATERAAAEAERANAAEEEVLRLRAELEGTGLAK